MYGTSVTKELNQVWLNVQRSPKSQRVFLMGVSQKVLREELKFLSRLKLTKQSVSFLLFNEHLHKKSTLMHAHTFFIKKLVRKMI